MSWGFRLAFAGCAIVSVVTQNIVGAVVLVAIAVVYGAERRL